MHWLIYVTIALFSYSGSVVIDKHLIDKKFEHLSATTITALAGLAGIPLLLLYFCLHPVVPPFTTMLNGCLAGWLVLAAYQLYYLALRRSEASLVATLFQFIIPANYLLGSIFLHEKLSLLSIVGLLVICSGAIVLSFEQRDGTWSLQTKTVLLMLGASLLISISDVVFKNASISREFSTLIVTEYASTILAGLLLFTFMPSVRKQIQSLRYIYKKVIILSQTNELCSFAGMIGLRYAITLGPIALVQGVMAAQPFVILLLSFGVAYITKDFSAFKQKSRLHLFRELAAMAFVVAGVCLVSLR